MLFPSRDVRKAYAFLNSVRSKAKAGVLKKFISNKAETVAGVWAGAYVGAGVGTLSGSKLTGTIIFMKYYNFIYFMESILNSSNNKANNQI